MKTWQKLLSLFLCAVLACGAFALQARADDTAVYVSASGDDATGDGSEANPYATLAKAVTEAPDGATVYVASDLVMTSCARFYNKNLTISSVPGAVYTVRRGEGFATQSDNARSWYNPAMIEVCGTPGALDASLRLENLVLNDAGRYEGSRFEQAVSVSGAGEDASGNMNCVQDAMIASYDGSGSITLGSGAVLRDFGGMSAVRVTGGSRFVMEAGSVIEDVTVTERTRGAGGNGPAGAVWLQGGVFEMKTGAVIRGLAGRAVYEDGGEALLDGTFSGLTGSTKMWFSNAGVVLHLRSQGSRAVLGENCLIEDTHGGDAIVVTGESCYLEMKAGAKILRTMDSKKSFEIGGSQNTVYIDGEIAGNASGGNAVSMNNSTQAVCTIGPNAKIHDNISWAGTIYMQGKNAELHVYGEIYNNLTTNRGGAIAVYNNFGPNTLYLYDGAKIHDNATTRQGGGIMITTGTFYMYGGEIYNNCAKEEGGGVYVRKGGTLIMNGGTISNNYSAKYGGGIAYDADPLGTLQPNVLLYGGTVSGNSMNAEISFDTTAGSASLISAGESNDLAVSGVGSSHMLRCVEVSDAAVLGDGRILMKKGNFFVEIPGKNAKIGNASGASETALKAASAKKGWQAPFAVFWTQEASPAAMRITGTAFDETLPVYAILIPTGEDGNPAADAQAVILRAPAGGEIALTVPASENGYAVALVQPDADYGTVTVSGPESVAYTGETVEVTYTVTYTLSESLKNRLEAGESLTGLTIVLQPDARLDAPETGLTVTGLTVDASNTTAQAEFRCTLPADRFETGKTLLTGGSASFALNGSAVLVPGNTVTTEMRDRPTFSVRYAWTGAPEGKYAPVPPESVFGLTEGAVHEVDRTYFAGYTIFEKDEYGNVTGEWVFSGWSRRGRITVTEDVLITGAWTYRKAEAVPDPVIPTGSAALTKTGAAGERLSGAVFALYRVGERDEYAGTYTTDRSGEIRIDGLFEGRYCFIETRAPEGYVTDGVRHEFTVTAGQTARLTVENRRETLYGVFSTEHFAYIVGYEDGCVRPEADITRAEVATIFFRLLDDRVREENMTAENAFADVDAGDWYNTAVSTMAAMGVVGGYPDGTFRPGEPITRAEFAAMAARFLSGDAAQGSAFADVQGHWAQREIGMAAAKGWVQGYEDGTFRPDRPITRAEAMTMINRVLNRNPASAEDLHDGMIVWKDNADTGKWYYLAVQEATNSHTYARRAGGSEFWLALCTNRDWTSLEK